MRPKLLLPAAILALLLVGQQLVISPLAERKAEQRLERDGGALEVDGRGLVAEPEEQVRVLDRLDGFSEVHIRLADFESGPLDVRSFRLERQETRGDYGLDMAAVSSPRELARFAGSQAGGPFGGILGDLAAGGLPGDGDRRLPITVRARVHSDRGEPEILDADATVAGISAGPLAELSLAAVVGLL